MIGAGRLEKELVRDLVIEVGGYREVPVGIAEEIGRRPAGALLGRVVESQGLVHVLAVLGRQEIDIFLLGREVADLVLLRLRFAHEFGIAEAAGQRRIVALDVGHEGHEQVVEGLEAAAEADGLGQRHVGLDLEVLGEDLPGGFPARPEPVGLGGRQPSHLAAGRRARQLTPLEVRLPVGLDPAEDGMVDVALLELLDGERTRPPLLVRDITQQPTRLGMIGRALHDVPKAGAGHRITRRRRFRRAPGQVEEIGRRATEDLLDAGAGLPRPRGRAGCHDVGQGDETGRAIRG